MDVVISSSEVSIGRFGSARRVCRRAGGDWVDAAGRQALRRGAAAFARAAVAPLSREEGGAAACDEAREADTRSAGSVDSGLAGALFRVHATDADAVEAEVGGDSGPARGEARRATTAVRRDAPPDPAGRAGEPAVGTGAHHARARQARPRRFSQYGTPLCDTGAWSSPTR
jgi:hypothetical protein